MTSQRLTLVAILTLSFAAFAGCKKDDRPQGPESIAVPDVTYSTSATDVEKGKELFTAKGCSACHKLGGGKLVGPDLKGVTARRHPKWIARMILKPDVMLKEDDIAKDLLKTHLTPMTPMNVDPTSDLPFVMAYLKSNET